MPISIACTQANTCHSGARTCVRKRIWASNILRARFKFYSLFLTRNQQGDIGVSLIPYTFLDNLRCHSVGLVRGQFIVVIWYNVIFQAILRNVDNRGSPMRLLASLACVVSGMTESCACDMAANKSDVRVSDLQFQVYTLYWSRAKNLDHPWTRSTDTVIRFAAKIRWMLSYFALLIRISGNTYLKIQIVFFNRRIRQIRLRKTIRRIWYGYGINMDTY